ncbi:hypothetical protein WA158_007773 [Blastocystis sp. Blastoise]
MNEIQHQFQIDILSLIQQNKEEEEEDDDDDHVESTNSLPQLMFPDINVLLRGFEDDDIDLSVYSPNELLYIYYIITFSVTNNQTNVLSTIIIDNSTIKKTVLQYIKKIIYNLFLENEIYILPVHINNNDLITREEGQLLTQSIHINENQTYLLEINNIHKVIDNFDKLYSYRFLFCLFKFIGFKENIHVSLRNNNDLLFSKKLASCFYSCYFWIINITIHEKKYETNNQYIYVYQHNIHHILDYPQEDCVYISPCPSIPSSLYSLSSSSTSSSFYKQLFKNYILMDQETNKYFIKRKDNQQIHIKKLLINTVHTSAVFQYLFYFPYNCDIEEIVPYHIDAEYKLYLLYAYKNTFFPFITKLNFFNNYLYGIEENDIKIMCSTGLFRNVKEINLSNSKIINNHEWTELEYLVKYISKEHFYSLKYININNCEYAYEYNHLFIPFVPLLYSYQYPVMQTIQMISMNNVYIVQNEIEYFNYLYINRYIPSLNTLWLEYDFDDISIESLCQLFHEKEYIDINSLSLKEVHMSSIGYHQLWSLINNNILYSLDTININNSNIDEESFIYLFKSLNSYYNNHIKTFILNYSSPINITSHCLYNCFFSLTITSYPLFLERLELINIPIEEKEGSMFIQCIHKGIFIHLKQLLLQNCNIHDKTFICLLDTLNQYKMPYLEQFSLLFNPSLSLSIVEQSLNNFEPLMLNNIKSLNFQDTILHEKGWKAYIYSISRSIFPSLQTLYIPFILRDETTLLLLYDIINEQKIHSIKHIELSYNISLFPYIKKILNSFSSHNTPYLQSIIIRCNNLTETQEEELVSSVTKNNFFIYNQIKYSF